MKISKNRLSKVILLVSATLLLSGFYFFERYGFTPGEQVAAPDRYPASMSYLIDPETPTLLVFAHPKCSCTQATLRELSRLRTRVQSKMAVHVLISYDPNDKFESQRIEKQAREIAGIQVSVDLNRKIAKSFNALTSGQTILYAPEGNILFQGGITASRGHEGANHGVEEIERIVSGPFIKTKYSRTPTFGCHL